MKYTVSITLLADGTVHRDKRVLGADPSELPWHIALKLLGLLLFFDPGLQVEQGLGWHYKPDLLSLDAEGRVRLWIDCGNISVRKVDRVANKVGAKGRFALLRCQRQDAALLLRLLEGRVRHPERVELLYFDDGFVDRFAGALGTTNEIEAERTDVRLEMVLRNRGGECRFASRVHRRRPEA